MKVEVAVLGSPSLIVGTCLWTEINIEGTCKHGFSVIATF